MIRRTHYFINKRFQARFAISFILLILAEAALIYALFSYISSDTLTTGYMDSILKIESTPNFFFMPFTLTMLIVGLGIALAGMVVFVLLSHRIAGPLYRFEKDLEDVAGGDLTKRINLRRTDQLTELKTALNNLFDSFDNRIGRIRDEFSELEELMTGKDDPANTEKIRRKLDLLKDEIERFRVSSGPRG